MRQALLKRHLFIVSSLYPPHLGGVERYTASLARILSARYRVDVFCMNTENEADIVETDGVTVHYLPCLPLFSGRLPLPKIAALRRFLRLCAELDPDAALIQTRLYPFNAFAVRELAKRGVPTLTVEHGTGYIDFGGRFFNAAWRGYEQCLSGFFRRAQSEFYAVSAAGLRWLRALGFAGRGVLPNGVDPADFAFQRGSSRSEFGVGPGDFLIVFAGRLLPEKGVLDLAEAVRAMNCAPVKLIYAGSGDAAVEERLRSLPETAFVGRLAHERWLRLLADCDVLCLPTRYPEGLPTVILEAGYLAVPVVASDAGGIVEVVRDSESGRIVESGDVAALARALTELRADETGRRSLGERLKGTVQEGYTWDRIGAKVAEAIERAIARSGRSIR